MKATCPNNVEHKKFNTVAHVTEFWVVDEEGNFLEVAEDVGEVTHGPDPGNIWICEECGAEAKVRD